MCTERVPVLLKASRYVQVMSLELTFLYTFTVLLFVLGVLIGHMCMMIPVILWVNSVIAAPKEGLAQSAEAL